MKRIFVVSALIVAPVLAVPLANAAPPPKTPASGDLTIGAQPNPITYGQATAVSGKLKGSLKSNIALTLQDNPAPFTRGYETAEATTTDRNGDYRFSNVRPLENSRYRVASVVPQALSDELLVQVRIKVVLRLSDSTPRRGQRVRFSGTAAPEHDGRLVYIQRRTSTGNWRTVRRTALRDAGSEFSSFATRIRVRRDTTYRARVFHDSDHADGTSRPKSARVH